MIALSSATSARTLAVNASRLNLPGGVGDRKGPEGSYSVRRLRISASEIKGGPGERAVRGDPSIEAPGDIGFADGFVSFDARASGEGRIAQSALRVARMV